MVITPNLPQNVVNWLICRNRVRCAITRLEELNKGYPSSYAEALRLKFEKRKAFTPEETLPARKWQLRRLRHFNYLKDRLSLTLNCDPDAYLLSQDEMISLIGKTLKFKSREYPVLKKTWHFETVSGISSDGKNVYSGSEWDCLEYSASDLLELGFGKGCV
ncbi:MAG: hypothetical protein E7053_07800 [Lentisphaerae bacterium]|nr:hypothetical protein [Lentisphaerota bacterium]